MKNKSLLLIIALFVIAAQPSFGAFPAKHPATTNVPENTAGPATDYGSGSSSVLSTKLSPLVNAFDGNHYSHRKQNNTLGTLSLIFGIAGIVTFLAFGGIYFGVPAIILGAIARKHKQKHALAGIILGICGFAASVIILVVAVAAVLSM